MKQVSNAIHVKLENLNLGGSHKARAARQIIVDAEKQGVLVPGVTLLEKTGGNLGIGLAIEANRRGYPLHLVVNLDFSPFKKRILQSYGAELVGIDYLQSGCSTLDTVHEILKRGDRAYYFPDQFTNRSGVTAHALSTAPEVVEFLDSMSCSPSDDVKFVAGIGTGASITAIGRAIKATFATAEVIAVQPANVDFQRCIFGAHPIQGTGVAYPPLLDPTVIDRYVTCSAAQMLDAQQWLVKSQGIFAGFSSGANVYVARQIEDEWERRARPKGRRLIIVTLIYDGGEGYMDDLATRPVPKLRHQSLAKKGEPK
jgi:cysteine synthase